jgi:multimeric flavodoxin WrbA
MNIITTLGSPRKKGNTATILSAFERLVRPCHNVQRINVVDYTVHGCLGCNHCQRLLDEPGCIQQDDVPGIFQRMFDADVIVYATPVYTWSVTAQMKALLDRHYCLVKWQDGKMVKALLEGKRAALLSTCGGTLEEDADLIQAMFDRLMQYLQCDVIGHYILPGCSQAGKLGDRADKSAREMAQAIIGHLA